MSQLQTKSEHVCERSVPATCGELIQGVLFQRHFLVNAPTDLYASVRSTLSARRLAKVDPRNQKINLVLRRIANMSPIRSKIKVELLASIPRGKGLASSSAEIAAAAYSAAMLLGVSDQNERIDQEISAVDQGCDGCHFSGVSLMAQLTGEKLFDMGPLPNLSFVLVDEGGEITTESIDREKEREVCHNNQGRLLDQLMILKRGFSQKNIELIAQASTDNARLYQEVQKKEVLEDLIAATSPVGALGVNCAHSGTVLGVMFDPHLLRRDRLIQTIEKTVGPEKVLGVHQLRGGGVL